MKLQDLFPLEIALYPVALLVVEGLTLGFGAMRYPTNPSSLPVWFAGILFLLAIVLRTMFFMSKTATSNPRIVLESASVIAWLQIVQVLAFILSVSAVRGSDAGVQAIILLLVVAFLVKYIGDFRSKALNLMSVDISNH